MNLIIFKIFYNKKRLSLLYLVIMVYNNIAKAILRYPGLKFITLARFTQWKRKYLHINLFLFAGIILIFWFECTLFIVLLCQALSYKKLHECSQHSWYNWFQHLMRWEEETVLLISACHWDDCGLMGWKDPLKASKCKWRAEVLSPKK